MSKGTIKEALAKLEAKEEKKACEMEEVKLLCQAPFIEKMDASLSTLSCCVKLSLSTNMIEKIANLNGLKHLKILSLGRNAIKNFSGLEAVGDTLEELWISYNLIEKLKGVMVLKKLKVLYISNNLIKDQGEISHLGQLQSLEKLLLTGNPVILNLDTEDLVTAFKAHVIGKCCHLRELDGDPVVRDEEE